MTPDEYLDAAARTGCPDYAPIMARLQDEKTVRLLHAALGLCTEVGEFQDALKKFLIYGKPLDDVNLEEELGDMLWYQALAIRTLKRRFEDAMTSNRDKLAVRYGAQFTEEKAITRDLESERKTLEGSKPPFTPVLDPLGARHHSEMPLTDEDVYIGDMLAWALGDLYIDANVQPARDQWQAVARALRIHGLQVVNR